MVSIITKFSQGLLFWSLKRHAATQKFEETLQFKNKLFKKNVRLFGIRRGTQIYGTQVKIYTL